MKRTGIVRRVDELGRIVLPKELRRTMEIDVKDPIEIYTDNEYIIVKNILLTVHSAEALNQLVNLKKNMFVLIAWENWKAKTKIHWVFYITT